MIEVFIALANAIIILRRLIRQVWTIHRRDKRPERRPLTYPRNLLDRVPLRELPVPWPMGSCLS